MDSLINPNAPTEALLLHGCWREAERADLVAISLDQLRIALPESLHSVLIALIEEIRATSRLLRDIADRSRTYFYRFTMVSNYLNILLPCLSKSLRDITGFYEDETLSREIRWRKMYKNMTDEAGGLPLPHRFMLYNHFLTLLKLVLARSPNFDLNTLELLTTRILALRESRGIPPPQPSQLSSPVRQDMMLVPMAQDHSAHWSEQIFTLPLPSRTALKQSKGPRARSMSFGPYLSFGQANIPPESKVLFRRNFDNERVVVTAVENAMNLSPYFFVTANQDGQALYSIHGAHELCISREDSALQLKRWSQSAQSSRLWLVLYFITWEEMVLFYYTFVSLKARNTMTVQIHPNEYKLSGEKRLFQAQIIDDSFKHSLIVYEDLQTHGIRLHAAVWEGELRQCPVWTAFVTHQSQSSTWLSRRSRHRIWLKDVQLYVFCQRYHQENMRQNKAGAFEIYFATEEGATRFKDLFAPSSTPESSEANDAVAGPSK